VRWRADDVSGGIDQSRAKGLPDFRAPPAIPKFIDTSQDTNELPSYDSFEPSPDDF